MGTEQERTETMENLHIFALGGTGERVAYSFLMLLAAGMPINAENVNFVFIDNDTGSKALANCQALIHAYRGLQESYQKYEADQTKWPSFCKTIVNEPKNLCVNGEDIINAGRLFPSPVEDQNDKEYGEKVQAFLDERELLFTEEELNIDLGKGFVGHPNIGAVAMNILVGNQIEKYNGKIGDKDGVIIVGSLFGGTGAAGIPFMVNKLNDQHTGRNFPIGVIATLPYFRVQPKEHKKEGEIIVDSDVFSMKSRAALMYYNGYMSGMDIRYYDGDSQHLRMFPYHDHGNEQDNPSDLIELMGARCIADFTRTTRDNRIIYKRPRWAFYSKNKSEHSMLEGVLDPETRKAMAKFKLMQMYFTHPNLMKYGCSDEGKWSWIKEIGFTEPLREKVAEEKDHNNYINIILTMWDKWLKELSNSELGNSQIGANPRPFLLFNDTNALREKDSQKILEYFYASKDHGIARTEQKNKGILGLGILGGEEVTVPVPTEFSTKAQDAYKVLNKNKNNKNLTEDKILVCALTVISKALDSVLEKNSTLE